MIRALLWSVFAVACLTGIGILIGERVRLEERRRLTCVAPPGYEVTGSSFFVDTGELTCNLRALRPAKKARYL